jgi:hypothetical protein
MKKTRKLKWGETPFDRMSQEDLLIHAKRMFLALTSSTSILSMSKIRDELSGGVSTYWGKDGMGGKALNLSKRTLGKIKRGYDSEDIYRMFFRYAEDVLFEPDENSRRWQPKPQKRNKKSPHFWGLKFAIKKYPRHTAGVFTQNAKQSLKVPTHRHRPLNHLRSRVCRYGHPQTNNQKPPRERSQRRMFK